MPLHFSSAERSQCAQCAHIEMCQMSRTKLLHQENSLRFSGARFVLAQESIKQQKQNLGAWIHRVSVDRFLHFASS